MTLSKVFGNKEPHLVEVVDEVSVVLHQIEENTSDTSTKDWCHNIIQVMALQVCLILTPQCI